MALRLYNTATRAVEPFTPQVPGEVGIYVCGATVQSSPHIGHLRSMVAFDLLRRWLECTGQRVTLVRNVTDIDDKILHNAGHAGIPWWQLAAHFEREFAAADRLLGNLPASIEPRATGHIGQMILLIEDLLARGHAYVAAGSVWFAVGSYPGYGELSGQRCEDMLASPESEPGKRNPHDFALWKAAREGEPSWPAPFGAGRPGWHIECSAMAETYLGAQFDIHGGGRDLLFPHHENERAQSCAAGRPFARVWMHNAWVTQAGEKMSKSLGNSLQVTHVVSLARPIEVRYYLLSAHYRSNLEYSPQALAEAATAFRRVVGMLERSAERQGAPIALPPTGVAPSLPPAFVAALNDDLSMPAALAVLFECTAAGNSALTSHPGDPAAIERNAVAVRAMLHVLGCDPFDPHWAEQGRDPRAERALATLVDRLLAERDRARARQDYAAADDLRRTLADAGIAIRDGAVAATGSRWSLADPTDAR